MKKALNNKKKSIWGRMADFSWGYAIIFIAGGYMISISNKFGWVLLAVALIGFASDRGR